jgi:hypothetical protein
MQDGFTADFGSFGGDSSSIWCDNRLMTIPDLKKGFPAAMPVQEGAEL